MSFRSRAVPALLAAAASFAIAAPAVAQQNAGQVSFGKLISALNNVAVQIDRVDALNDLTVEDVQVVNVEDTLNGNRVRALNNALRDADIDALQNFLNDNEIIKDSLNNNDIALNDVLAISVLDGGEIVVFVQ